MNAPRIMRRVTFAPNAPCAIEPKAFGFWFDPPPPPSVTRVGDVAIVDIRGPLMHHEEWWCDSYDAIKARVAEALASGAKSIVMSIDSPGGLVSGCFDTAEEIRAMCDEADVGLFAYVDGQACSAAYALASVAQRIVVPSTGTVGSIGVIAELVSAMKMDAMWGVERRLVTSGARKADGHPAGPITDSAEAAVQSQVDQLAGLFFEHVARGRGGQPEAFRALEAGVLIGASATPLLADDVMGLDAMLAALAAGELTARGAEETDMGTKNGTQAPQSTTRAESSDDDTSDKDKNAKARALLQKMADDGDDEAKAALADMDGDEPDADAPVPEKKDDDDKKDKDALAAVAALGARVTSLETKATAGEAAERAELIASRTDLDDATRDLLASAPLAKVRAFVKTTPKKATAKPAVTVPITRGATQGKAAGATKTPTSATAEEVDEPQMEQDAVAARAMRARMGLVKNESSIIDDGAQLIVGAPPGYVV